MLIPSFSRPLSSSTLVNLFPYGSKIATLTNFNFLWLTKSSRARRVMPSHLGGFPPRVTNAPWKIEEVREVLKIWIALNCSLTHNLPTQHLDFSLITNSHKESIGKHLTRLWKALAITRTSTTPPRAVELVYILEP